MSLPMGFIPGGHIPGSARLVMAANEGLINDLCLIITVGD
jgi:hypothetical protein